MHTHNAKHKIGHTVLGNPNNTHHRKGQAEECAPSLQTPSLTSNKEKSRGTNLGKARNVSRETF